MGHSQIQQSGFPALNVARILWMKSLGLFFICMLLHFKTAYSMGKSRPINSEDLHFLSKLKCKVSNVYRDDSNAAKLGKPLSFDLSSTDGIYLANIVLPGNPYVLEGTLPLKTVKEKQKALIRYEGSEGNFVYKIKGHIDYNLNSRSGRVFTQVNAPLGFADINSVVDLGFHNCKY